MPTPKQAEDALRRAVDAQKSTRDAAAASKKTNQAPIEEGMERADSDAEQ